jgi:hypothetical protein
MGKFIGELEVPNRGWLDVAVEIGLTVTFADADFVGSAWLVAVTVTVVASLTAGAVNCPPLEIVPADAVHATPVFVEPLTLAENC